VTAAPARPLLDEALAAHAAGLAVLPPRQDGTKRPDGQWKAAQHTRPTEAEIRAWYANGRTGLGIVCGAVSGNLEMLELDHPLAGADRNGTWRALLEAARAAGCYELLERIALGYAETTPSGGMHVLYRCEGPVDGNTKLAQRDALDDELVGAEVDARAAGHRITRVIFETRGEGGYVVCAPSHGTVHPTGGAWRVVAGSFADIVTITAAERAQLLAVARTFDQTPPAPAPLPARPAGSSRDTSTGSWMDDTVAAFNDATTWPQILEPHGWTHAGHQGGVDLWTRPGKETRDGHSATVNANGTDRLILWSSTVSIAGVDVARGGGHAPSYDRFAVWAGYHHGGDRRAAAEACRRSGIGPAWTERDSSSQDALIRQVAEQKDRNITDLLEPSPEAPTHQPAPTLDLRWTDELAGSPEPEPPELIEGVLRRGELAALAAPRAIGKTFVGLNMAAQLAAGEGQLFGRLAIRRKARVLYLQGELDRWGSQERWFGLYGVTDLEQLAGTAPDLPRVAESFDAVRIRTISRRTTVKTDAGAMVEEHVDAVIDPRIEATIRNEGIDVVIIDPWAVYFAGKENSNDEVEAALAQLRAITLRTGVAWVVIHHISAKIEQNRLTEPEDLWRGATRLADWASTRITILPHYSEAQRKELDLSRYDARRHVDVHFLRRSKPIDDFTARRSDNGWWEAWDDPKAEDNKKAGTEAARTPGVSVPDVLLAIARHGGSWNSMTEAAAALDSTRPTVEKALTKAVMLGHLEWTSGPRGAKGVRLLSLAEIAQNESGNDVQATRARDVAGPRETNLQVEETSDEQGERP
jgi:hypothetical protein